MSAHEDGLRKLLDFGFTRDQATIALLSSDDRFEQALELLLREGEGEEAPSSEGRAADAPPSKPAIAALPVVSITSEVDVKELEDELLFESSVREMLTPSHSELRALSCKSNGKGGSSIYLKGPGMDTSTYRLDLALAMGGFTDVDDVIYLEVEMLTPVHMLGVCGSSWSPALDEELVVATETASETVIGIAIDRRLGRVKFSSATNTTSEAPKTVDVSISFSPVIPLVLSLLPGQVCCISVGLSPFKLQPPPGSRSFYDAVCEAVRATSNVRAASAPDASNSSTAASASASASTPAAARPLIEGDVVARGPDWKSSYGNQDGGAGKLGTVISTEVAAGGARVRWHFDNSKNVYRFRPGAFDLVVVKAAHVPAGSSAAAGFFVVGCTVLIKDVDVYVAEVSQEDMGGWNSSMAKHLGKRGKVIELKNEATAKVEVDGQSFTWNRLLCQVIAPPVPPSAAVSAGGDAKAADAADPAPPATQDITPSMQIVKGLMEVWDASKSTWVIATSIAQGLIAFPKGSTLLHAACALENGPVLAMLLDSKVYSLADCAALDAHGLAVGNLASSSANFECLRILLESGMPFPKQSLFVQACGDGNLKLVEFFISWGVDPDGADEAGTTPIFAAVSRAREEVACLLLKSDKVDCQGKGLFQSHMAGASVAIESDSPLSSICLCSVGKDQHDEQVDGIYILSRMQSPSGPVYQKLDDEDVLLSCHFQPPVGPGVASSAEPNLPGFDATRMSTQLHLPSKTQVTRGEATQTQDVASVFLDITYAVQQMRSSPSPEAIGAMGGNYFELSLEFSSPSESVGIGFAVNANHVEDFLLGAVANVRALPACGAGLNVRASDDLSGDVLVTYMPGQQFQVNLSTRKVMFLEGKMVTRVQMADLSGWLHFDETDPDAGAGGDVVKYLEVISARQCFPGDHMGSFGFHSMDGRLRSQMANTLVERFEPLKNGDVLGVGVNVDLDIVFLTKNGSLLGLAFSIPKDTETLHPVVTFLPSSGSVAPPMVTLNNGSHPFLFKSKDESTPVVPCTRDVGDAWNKIGGEVWKIYSRSAGIYLGIFPSAVDSFCMLPHDKLWHEIDFQVAGNFSLSSSPKASQKKIVCIVPPARVECFSDIHEHSLTKRRMKSGDDKVCRGVSHSERGSKAPVSWCCEVEACDFSLCVPCAASAHPVSVPAMVTSKIKAPQVLNVRSSQDLSGSVVKTFVEGDVLDVLINTATMVDGSLRVQMADRSGWSSIRLEDGTDTLTICASAATAATRNVSSSRNLSKSGVVARVNRAGVAVARGTGEGKGNFYCGRILGALAMGPGSDGQCGPNSGPQCPSCVGITFQVKTAKDLRSACQDGDLGKVKRLCALIPRGPDSEVDECEEEHGYTAAHRACQQGHADCLRAVLDHGADLNKRTNKAHCSWAPIHSATWFNSHDCIRELVARGADLLAKASWKAGGSAWDTCGIQDGTSKETKAETLRVLNEALFQRKLASLPSWTLLNIAAASGQSRVVEAILDKSLQDLEVANLLGHTPLFSAVLGNHLACVELLLSKNAAVEKVDHEGYTVVHAACRKNNAAIVKLLADKGAVMTACLPCGTTPVLTVVRHNLGGEVLDVLCLAGADVNARDARGETALQVAAREGRTSLVKRLLEAADIDLEIAGVGTVVRPIEPIVIESKHPYANNTNDFTPVLVPGATRLVVTFDPASSTENQCDYVRLLKNNAGRKDILPGADKFTGGSGGSQKKFPGVDDAPPYVVEGDSFIVQFVSDASGSDWGYKLVVTGEKMDEVPNCSPLHTAALFGHADVADLLLRKGADAGAVNAAGKIPLQLACENLHVEACASLLKAAPETASATDPATNYSMVQLVVRAAFEGGKEGHQRSHRGEWRDGRGGFHCALNADSKGSSKFLCLHESVITAPHWSCCGEKNREALGCGPEIPVEASLSLALPESAAGGGYDVAEPQRKEASPACRLLQLLVGHGCDVNQADPEGCTALHVAVQAGSTDLVTVLLSLKADPEKRNFAGLKSLYLALALGHAQVVAALLQAGADFPHREHAEAMAGAVALQITPLIEVLLQHGVAFPAYFPPESPLHREPLYSACIVLGLGPRSMAKILAHALHDDSGGNQFAIKIPKQRNALKFPSFRFDLPILPSSTQDSPVIYWEVTLVTSGLMQIGICSARWSPKRDPGSWGCGDDLESLAIDGSRDCCWLESQRKIEGGFVWSPGDVVGIAVDVANQSVDFYLHEIKVTGVPHMDLRQLFASPAGVVPCASLGNGEEVIFNFGAQPDAHPLQHLPPGCISLWDYGNNNIINNGNEVEWQTQMPAGLEVFEFEDPEISESVASWSPVARHHGLQMRNGDALGCLFDVLKEGHEAVLRPVLTEHRELAMELCDPSSTLGKRALAVSSKSNSRILHELGKAPAAWRARLEALLLDYTADGGLSPAFCAVWIRAVAEDAYAEVVNAILHTNRALVGVLSEVQDREGRMAKDVATKKCKRSFYDRIRFVGRYMLHRQAEHRSLTCCVLLGDDCLAAEEQQQQQQQMRPSSFSTSPKGGADSPLSPGGQFPGTPIFRVPSFSSSSPASTSNKALRGSASAAFSAASAAGAGAGAAAAAPVALKFMKLKDQFEKELKAREGLDPAYVITVLRTYSHEDPIAGSSFDYMDEVQARGLQDYPYCLVLPAADRTLKHIIDHEHIAGRDFDAIKSIGAQLARAVGHLHSQGRIHGDLKPLNVVRQGADIKLIDLDASCFFSEWAGAKWSSAYLPPEMLYRCNDGTVVVREPPPPSAAAEDEQAAVVAEGRSSHTLAGLIPYDLVKASPAQDMWSLGCILFHLCSGETLFQSNDEDDITSQKNLEGLFEWTHATKQEKINKIPHLLARNLVSQLLMLDPQKRLASTAHLLAHPFFSGQSVGRLLGDPAAFDVFISYRVETEEALVDRLEALLRDRGIKVWRDKTNLQDGVSWEVGFTDGLVKSRIFLPLLSRRGVKDKYLKLSATSACDNVLLEHRLALELSQRGFMERIFPIFVGDVDSQGDYGHYFRQGCHYDSSLAHVVVAAVETKLVGHLERQGLGVPLVEASSAGSVLEGIAAAQGCFVEGTETDPKLDLVADKVLKMVRDLQKEQEDKEGSGSGGLPEEVLALQAELERERKERAGVEARLAEAEDERGRLERSLSEEIARLTSELALRAAPASAPALQQQQLQQDDDDDDNDDDVRAQDESMSTSAKL